MVTYNNCNTINFTNKNTSSEDFDHINNILLDDISDNMVFLVQTVDCSATDTRYLKTTVYADIKFLSNTVILKGVTPYIYMYLNQVSLNSKLHVSAV